MSKITGKDLKHLPKSKGLPLLGDFLKIGKKGTSYFKEKQSQLGNIFSINFAIGTFLAVLGEDNNKYLLKNLNEKVTAKGGYFDIFKDIYPNCLLQMDGEKHKRHRSIMQKAFSMDALEDYMEEMPPVIQQTIDELHQEGTQPVKVYPHFKLLTLRIATKIFFGISDANLVQKIMDAISPMTQAQYSLQVNIPGTVYHKALKGRKFLVATFSDIIKERRQNPQKDLFSKMCFAKSDEGEVFTDDEIIDHMIFMVQASHDTTAWTITSLAYYLAKHPDWQERLRTEITPLADQQSIAFKSLIRLPDLNLFFKEAMRLSPSVGNMFREADEAIEVEGKTIPKGTKMWMSTSLPLKDPKYWSNPEAFDPERFNDERNEYKKCPHAYLPFGAGAHLCIGNIFAEMSVKLAMVFLLKNFEVSVPENYTQQMQEIPMTMPKDGMPIFIKSIN